MKNKHQEPGTGLGNLLLLLAVVAVIATIAAAGNPPRTVGARIAATHTGQAYDWSSSAEDEDIRVTVSYTAQ